MARIDKTLEAACKTLPQKPAANAPSTTKKNYSQKVSNALALAMADELRARNLKETLPSAPGVAGSSSGAERRLSGGIGAKKVDVSWSTEDSGLLLGLSIKSINFRDGTTNNFQKNLTNRRGDMLFESVTLHRRFPFAVLGGFIFLDKDAANDASARRKSTFVNAHQRLRLFTNRDDPEGREEQYERLYIILFDGNGFQPQIDPYAVGDPNTVLQWEDIFDDLLRVLAERNPDFYEENQGKLRKVGR